jgi:hypothetical protein
MKALSYSQAAVLFAGAPLVAAHSGDHGQVSWLHSLVSPDHATLWLVFAGLGLTLLSRPWRGRRRVRVSNRQR